MSKYTQMREMRLKMENAKMSLADALNQAMKTIPPENGWIMAEAPEKILWQPLEKIGDASELGHCLSFVAFGPRAEVRFQRNYGDELGHMRLVREDPEGMTGMERLSSCLLGKNGRLTYAEFFRRDEESGILKLELARYCGVGGSDGN